MSKKFFSLILTCCLLVSANTVVQVLEFSAPVVRDNVVYFEGGFPIAEVYAPEVCTRAVKLVLQPGRQAKSVSVQYEDLVRVEGNYYLEPHLPVFNEKGRPPQKRGLTEADKRMIDQFYQRDALYPGIKRNMYPVVTQFKCGIPVGITAITPVQYNPVREELYYYKKATVTMETEPVDPSRDIAGYKCTPFIKSIVQRIVDNKADVLSLPYTVQDADDYDYLIVSREDMVTSGWDDFVAFNQRRGMKTEVHAIKAIVSDPQNTGSDYAEKLRTFIKRQYNDHKITFVLIGGDCNQSTSENSLPYREFYSIFYDHYHRPDRLQKKLSATEYYYEGLDGDWKGSESKWALPGNEDIFVEVYCARFTIDNATHYANLSNKTFKYSEAPVKDEVKRALFMGGQLWEDDNDPGQYIWGIDDVLGSSGYCTDFGFNTYGIPDDGSWATDICSDKENGSQYSWMNSGLKSHIDSHYPAWINHTGHGNNTMACQTNMNYINDSWITNNGENHNFFFLISGACLPGNFDEAQNCWGETFVTIKNGAVATYLNNNSGYGDDDDNNAPSARLTRYLHDALINKDKRVPFLAALQADSREACVEIILANDTTPSDPTGYFGIIRFSAYNTNIFGDPALNMWTEVPQEISSNEAKSRFDIVANKDEFTMKTPPYTWVALVNNTSGEIITTQLTGYINVTSTDTSNFNPIDSTCKINNALYKTYAAGNEKVKVMVKAHNYLPFESEVTIEGTGINSLSLKQNINRYRINTANGSVLIHFNLSAEEFVNISIYNSKGVLVKTVLNNTVKAGVNNSIKINKNLLGSGVYYSRLKTKKVCQVKSFIVLDR